MVLLNTVCHLFDSVVAADDEPLRDLFVRRRLVLNVVYSVVQRVLAKPARRIVDDSLASYWVLSSAACAFHHNFVGNLRAAVPPIHTIVFAHLAARKDLGPAASPLAHRIVLLCAAYHPITSLFASPLSSPVRADTCLIFVGVMAKTRHFGLADADD